MMLPLLAIELVDPYTCVAPRIGRGSKLSGQLTVPGHHIFSTEAIVSNMVVPGIAFFSEILVNGEALTEGSVDSYALREWFPIARRTSSCRTFVVRGTWTDYVPMNYFFDSPFPLSLAIRGRQGMRS